MSRSMSLVLVLALAGSSSSIALAGLSQASIAAPGGFIQTLAAPATGTSNPWAGSDLTIMFTSPSTDLQEATFAGNSSVFRASSHSSANTTNSASGTVGMGFLKLQAQNNGPNNSNFAAADANGGWKDTFTITAPGLTGQSGFMQFTLNVTGSLAASGFAGLASFGVTGYKDNNQLMSNSLANPGNSDLIGTDRQYGNWVASSAPDTSKNVNGVITMAVPFTYGTPFTLGIYARAHAGMRSSSGVPGNSQATVAFQNTLVWGGISNMYFGGTTNTTTNYSIDAASGVDWRGVVPSPAVASLMGMAGLVATRRRR
jgi:hypothetical protein